MNLVDKLFAIAIVSVVTIAIIAFALSVYDGNLYAVTAEKAQQACEAKGYDTYEQFSRKVLGDVPYGIRCNYIANRKEIIVDGQNDEIIAITT